jgi:hypothetical protein
MKRSVLWLPVLGIALSATPSVSAQRAWRPVRVPPPPRQEVSVQLEDEEGARLPTFVSGAQTFVLGSWGQRYNIRVSNLGPRRVEVVLAVDGRDAVSGQPTDLVRHRGYVIPGYGNLRVEGFRNSLESVASFRFTDPGDSYSTRMGTPQQQGFISVAVYPERNAPAGPIAIPEERTEWQQGPGVDDMRRAPSGAPRAGQTRAAKRPAPAAAAAPHATDEAYAPWRDQLGAQGGNLGTQYGETRASHVVEVDFERDRPTQPAQRITLRYDDAAGLEARGIALGPRPLPPAPWPVAPPRPQPRRDFAQPPPPRDPWLWYPWEWPAE